MGNSILVVYAGVLLLEWLGSQAEGNDVRQQHRQALIQPCLDYGRSFINTTDESNAPLFWVESRCRISDPATGETAEYFQCGSCKSENTFAESGLFQENNYDFLPVFGDHHCVIFRRHAQFTEGYREVRPAEEAWGGTAPCLRPFTGRVLTSPQAIFKAMDAGKPIIGQTELRDEETGRTAVIEYPVKTLNRRRSEGLWQVDTGPVLLPDLSAPPDQWSQTLRLAYIAFRTWDWADFVVEQPTPVIADGEEVAQVYHYSGLMHMETRNVLLALDK